MMAKSTAAEAREARRSRRQKRASGCAVPATEANPNPPTQACQGADRLLGRISLLHLQGVPWVRIGEAVGQRNLSVTADVYSYVILDETELDYERMLA
jgi:hypothetical protein